MSVLSGMRSLVVVWWSWDSDRATLHHCALGCKRARVASAYDASGDTPVVACEEIETPGTRGHPSVGLPDLVGYRDADARVAMAGV